MKVQSILLKISLIIATDCLGAGYILAGHLMILPALLIIVLYWMLTKKRSVFWSASGSLLAYIFLAGIGIIINLSLELMIFTCTAALVCWDLFQFNQGTAENSPNPKTSSLEKVHLQSLIWAASAGLAVAFMSAYITLQLSFGLTALLVLMAVGGLTYSLNYLLKKE
ncbi:hypothetical protein ACFLZW_03795 [Chloroflexota bacterium]